MTPALTLRLVTYLLVATGLTALAVAGLIGAAGTALVGSALLASWWLEGGRERGAVRPLLLWSLVAVAAAAVALDLLYLARSLLDGMVHLLLFLILARLVLRRGAQDLREAGSLSFFLLIAASSVTFSVGFFFVFAVFALLGTWMLLLQHVVAESEAAGAPTSAAGQEGLALRGPLVRVGVVAAAATFAIAGALFFVIPRVGQAALPLHASLGRMVTGFSDRVELGAYGEIERDRTVVMRVYFPDAPMHPTQLPNLRWRGLAFDRFDGRTWSVGQPRRVVLRRSGGGDFSLGAPRGRGPLVRQEVYLDPIGTDVVFAAPWVVRMELRTGTVSVDDTGAVSVPSASARLHYVADSELELTPPRDTRARGAGAPLLPHERARYLQLPPLAPLIPKLARDVAAGSRDSYEAALRLTEFLSTRYTYTLALRRDTPLPPLEEFLFVRRSGNCEYFAAALAVMLRTLEIPARVVAGFQRGEWNPYGGYYMVRLADAHSWVEAYFDGLGWVTLDPSPRADTLSPPGLFAHYLDAARMRWYRYIVNWSFQDQAAVAATIHRQAAELTWSWPRGWPARSWFWGAGLALGAAVLGWLVRRAGGLGRAARPAARMPRFYERALRALDRRGFRLEAAETARRFAARVSAALPALADPIERLTRAYERCRFGAAGLGRDEQDELDRCVRSLERT
jgi:transglutaminase-like putative cysteine protease